MGYKIAYVIPFFGKFNNYFQLWLDSCSFNQDIDFLIFTDDRGKYRYPGNVHVKYISWSAMKERIQKLYDFELSLESPYRLCDFRPAYGEIFREELEGYDYWGHCDLDLIWGNIRRFMTDEVLENYDRIGFMGHSSLYRNIPEINGFYKMDWDGEPFYKKAFQEDKTHFFDEWGSIRIMKQHGFKVYQEIIFANPTNLYWRFYLCYFPNKEDYRNRYQAFVWKKQVGGGIYRVYLDKKGNKQIEEFMYLHLISRNMEFTNDVSQFESVVIVPNKFIGDQLENAGDIKKEFLRKCNKRSIRKYLQWWKEREGSWLKVIKYIKGTLRSRRLILYKNDFKIE